MTRSYWLDEALGAEAGAPAPRLEGDERADVCIVGGGYTGLWTAINLKSHEPSLDVALVEADICGAGASSRNAGFLVNLWPKFSTLEKICGAEEALRLGRASAAAIGDLLGFCADHGIDVQHQPVGWLWGSTCAAQAGNWNEAIDALERHQIYPYRRLSGAEITERTGSKVFIEGVIEFPVVAPAFPDNPGSPGEVFLLPLLGPTLRRAGDQAPQVTGFVGDLEKFGPPRF